MIFGCVFPDPPCISRIMDVVFSFLELPLSSFGKKTSRGFVSSPTHIKCVSRGQFALGIASKKMARGEAASCTYVCLALIVARQASQPYAST